MGSSIKQFVSSLPELPGIYKMLNESGKVIYIGKANNLKKRVSSYFSRSPKDNKTSAMVLSIDSIEFTVTRGDLESLILEHNLIKNHKPKYNIILRDDKSFPFIKVTYKHKFPQLSFYRGRRKEGSLLYGPYPSSSSVRIAINQLQKIFKIRTCDDIYFSNRSRPCLQYQMHRCSAPCVNMISEQEYRQDINNAEYFLKGKDKIVIKKLIKKMDNASDNLDYEKATILRNQLADLKRIESQQIVSLPSGNFDVISLLKKFDKYCISVFNYRRGELIGNKSFIDKPQLDTTHHEILKIFLLQYYDNRVPPKEIITNYEPNSLLAIENRLGSLSNQKVSVKINVRGKRLKLLNMAIANSLQLLTSNQKKYHGLKEKFTKFSHCLNLNRSNLNIECFDVSHTSGENTVASCVRFNIEGPVKNSYRKFNINNIIPGDDYHAIGQAIERRFLGSTKELNYPDVLIIDGGKGQILKAYKIIKDNNLDIIVLSIAKGKNRNYKNDTIYSIINSKPNKVSVDKSSFFLVQEIRDEAHRFAIESHRASRSKRFVSSPLDSIKGIGSAKRMELLKQFGGLQGITKATIEDLRKVEGVSLTLAERIFKHLRN